MTTTKYLLSLDGGGIRGIFSAAALVNLQGVFQASNKSFDLIAGTSTGAIIGLALSIGMPPSEILSSYKAAADAVFGRPRNVVRRLWCPKHSNAGLKAWLQKLFEDRTMDDAKVPVIVPTYEVSIGQPRVWKTRHHPSLMPGSLKMVDVALMSCAAPTYLPAVQYEIPQFGPGTYLDGGVFANNPSLVAYVDALKYLGALPDEIRLLSIGTGGAEKWAKPERVVNRGLDWAMDLIDLQFQANARHVDEMIRLLLGNNHYVRVNKLFAERIRLDDCAQIDRLETLGSAVGMGARAAVAQLLA